MHFPQPKNPNDMKWNNFSILLVAILSALASCQEGGPKPQVDDGHPPAAITDPSWEALPGAVKISYSLPSDPDLFYVEADCETATGKRSRELLSMIIL